VLNVEFGRAIKTHTGVEALKIAGGETGPSSYYHMLAGGDAHKGAMLEGSALLAEMMNANRPV